MTALKSCKCVIFMAALKLILPILHFNGLAML